MANKICPACKSTEFKEKDNLGNEHCKKCGLNLKIVKERTRLTKKMFREYLNQKEDERIAEQQKKYHTLPKDFIEREVKRCEGHNRYHATKRKQGDYLYFQDRDMFNHLFEEWKEDKLNDLLGGLSE